MTTISQFLGNVSNFLTLETASELSVVDKTSRKYFAETREENEYVDRKRKRGIGNLNIAYGKSRKLTSIGFRSKSNCVRCGRPWGRIHGFFNLVVCDDCGREAALFRTRGLKSLSREYFLSHTALEENVATRRFATYSTALESEVLAYARRVNPYLDTMIGNRKEARANTMRRKALCRASRIDEIRSRFTDLVDAHSGKVDRRFLRQDGYDFCSLIMKDHALYGFIHGDAVLEKVRCDADPGDVAGKCFDYASMVSFMKKRGLLGEHFETKGDMAIPEYIFRRHDAGCLHYMESCLLYYECARELEERAATVLNLSLNTARKRRTACKLICAEEGIAYDDGYFDDYVLSNEGNAAEIVREYNKYLFLHRHSFHEYYSTFSSRNMGHNRASHLAKKTVLSNTLGFPVFRRRFVADPMDVAYQDL